MEQDTRESLKRSLAGSEALADIAPSAELIRGDEQRPELGDGNPTKKLKTNGLSGLNLPPPPDSRKKGVAAIKAEYIIHAPENEAHHNNDNGQEQPSRDDEAEASHHHQRDSRDDKSKNKQKKQRGQNTNRTFGSSRDAIALCKSRVRANEFSPEQCPYGDKCKFEHDLRKYLNGGKRSDLDTFNGSCPIFEARGTCPAGWRCRFAKAHSTERQTDDGRSELVQISKDQVVHKKEKGGEQEDEDAEEHEGSGIVNVLPLADKLALRKRKIQTPKADAYNDWLNKHFHDTGSKPKGKDEDETNESSDAHDNRAQYVDPPFLPSEKRRIYYGAETPVLAPLTTQGNLPYRRLCVDLGAQVTWSEMAMSLPLIQAEKAEWALLKAHESELQSPKFNPKSGPVFGYDNHKDMRFGAQISGNKPWVALKATEVITGICPHLRAIDLNCGCPIDLVYRQGAGSALLDTPGKLEKILRGMNSVSGEVPVTVKIRMGTKDNHPTAHRLVDRLAHGGPEAMDAGIGPAGIAAITLHGRSRQQRYTRSADWSYISQCAAVIDQYNKRKETLVDTINEPDERSLANGKGGKIYFVGNGDCYSHLDYYEHIDSGQVDSVMVARGALIKPWIFEEIEKGQYLDKSSSERLQYVERFAKYGMDAWGSDEIGLGTTRKFLLEWLSFACRYVPLGLLEHRPDIQDRPPAYRGRDDLETLLSSEDYRDWIKISEMFLGPAHKDFRFEPKHRSNNRDGDANIQAEG